jgi:hypothetical protein
MCVFSRPIISPHVYPLLKAYLWQILSLQLCICGFFSVCLRSQSNAWSLEREAPPSLKIRVLWRYNSEVVALFYMSLSFVIRAFFLYNGVCLLPCGGSSPISVNFAAYFDIFFPSFIPPPPSTSITFYVPATTKLSLHKPWMLWCSQIWSQLHQPTVQRIVARKNDLRHRKNWKW